MTESRFVQESFDFTPVIPQSTRNDSTKVLSVLSQATQLGILREIDYSLALFFYSLSPETATAAFLLTSALLSYSESLGHTCLSIDQLTHQGLSFLGISNSSDSVSEIALLLPRTKDDFQLELLKSPLIRFEALEGVESVVCVTEHTDQGQPLVLCRNQNKLLLYFRRHYQSETLIANAVVDKCRKLLPVDELKAAELLDLLFPKSFSDLKYPELDWQKIACALALRSSFTLITGGPGTGKTYTVSRLIALILALNDDVQKLKIALVAPTGKAASRLYRSIQNSLQELSDKLHTLEKFSDKLLNIGVAKTLHSLLGARRGSRTYRHHSGNPLDLDVLIVDESSMISIEMMSALLRALQPNTQLILLGDKNQLSSVEAGSVFGELCKSQPFELLQTIDGINEFPIYGQDVKEFLQRVASSLMTSAHPNSLDGNDLAFSSNVIRDHIVKLQRSHRFGGPIGQFATFVNEGASVDAWQVIRIDASASIFIKTTEDPQAIFSVAMNGRSINPSQSSAESNLTSHYQQYWDLIRQAFKDGLLRQYSKAPSAFDSVSNIFIQRKNSQQFLEEQTNCIINILKTFDGIRILCAVNEGPLGVDALNDFMEQGFKSLGYIQDASTWYVGKAIMLTRNQPELELSNGDVGLVLPSLDGDEVTNRLKVYFLAGDGLQSVALNRLDAVQTAYAMSIHKSQGSEFDHALLVLPKNMDQALNRELLYTGITRAKTYLTIFQAQNGLIDMAIAKKTDRDSGLVSRISSVTKNI